MEIVETKFITIVRIINVYEHLVQKNIDWHKGNNNKILFCDFQFTSIKMKCLHWMEEEKFPQKYYLNLKIVYSWPVVMVEKSLGKENLSLYL